MRLGLDESKGRDIDEEVDTHYRALRLIWVAFLAFVVAVFFVTRLLTPDPESTPVLFWILLAVGLGQLGGSFIIKQKLLKQASAKQNSVLIRNAYIVAYGLCESVALFGLIVYLATGVQYYYFFFVLGGFGVLVHKPQRDELLAVLGHEEMWSGRKQSDS